MLIDSHCHLDRIDLAPYQNNFACFMHEAANSQIEEGRVRSWVLNCVERRVIELCIYLKQSLAVHDARLDRSQ